MAHIVGRSQASDRQDRKYYYESIIFIGILTCLALSRLSISAVIIGVSPNYAADSITAGSIGYFQRLCLEFRLALEPPR